MKTIVERLGPGFVATIFASALLPAMSPAAAARPAHLYVAAGISGEHARVLRFLVIDGKPQAKPDLVLPRASGPVAASPAGGVTDVVYAQSARGIVAFSDGSKVPSREIVLPHLAKYYYWLIVGMAVDRDGYLYVGVAKQDGNGLRFPRRSLPKPLQGVFVYAPDADGLAQPARVVDPIPGVFEGMALDAAGDLVLLSETSFDVGLCRIVTNPRTNPHLAGSFTSTGLGTIYGATATRDDVFVSTFVSNPYRYVVSVFPLSSRGAVAPSRSISPAAGSSITGPLAYAAGTLAVASLPYPFSVFLFNGDGNGTETPFRSLALPHGNSGVAFGR